LATGTLMNRVSGVSGDRLNDSPLEGPEQAAGDECFRDVRERWTGEPRNCGASNRDTNDFAACGRAGSKKGISLSTSFQECCPGEASERWNERQ
jgi:hypothetical protein